MPWGVEVGLDAIAGNANLTFIFFVAFVLQAMIAVRFGYYARRNRAASDVRGQGPIWLVLEVAGLAGGTYALLGVLDITTSLATPYRNAALFAHVALLAMALRFLHHQAIPATDDETEETRRLWGRALWVGVLVGVLAVGVGTSQLGLGTPIFVLEALASLAFVTVGVAAGVSATAESTVQGTVVDTLLRHLLPVLLFAAFVPLLSLAVVAGLAREVVLHVQVVFVIMAATALMTATIKLRQNLAGL